MSHREPTSSASRVGTGCASLGSRLGAREGLQALERAYDAGITWFDLAPSYGDGEAEAIFAGFARGRRDFIQVATKVGIQSAGVGPFRRLMRPLARPIAGASASMRRIVARARPAAQRQPLSGTLVNSSIDASLSRLQIQQVEALMLHDPSPEDLNRDDVWRALEGVIAAGKARRVGIAGSVEMTLLAVGQARPVQIAQFACALALSRPAQVRKALDGTKLNTTIVTHSVGSTARLAAELPNAQQAREALAKLGYRGRGLLPFYAAALDLALADDAQGRVLIALSPRHARQNLAQLDQRPKASASDIRRALLGGAPTTATGS